MNVEGGNARLDLRPVSSLLPHEETIPAQLTKLASQIKVDGVQKDPLIVDRESGAVLDGMHRLGAFVKLGLENVVCCLVDYSSSGIELSRWARVYAADRKSLASQAISGLGFTEKVPLARAFELLESRATPLALMGSGGSFIQAGRMDIEKGFGVVRRLDGLAATLGWHRSFVREDEVDIALQDSENMVLLVQRLNKQDVLTAARTGRLFPCKTSMHTIDPRPVGLNFPIASLDHASSRQLAEFLSKRPQKILPPGSVYEGRRYKERLLLLDES